MRQKQFKVRTGADETILLNFINLYRMIQSWMLANNCNSSEICCERQMLLYVLDMDYAKKPSSLILLLLLCQMYRC